MFDGRRARWTTSHKEKGCRVAEYKLKCTRIVIAHRLSTIRQCDHILVLDQGKIVEDGTYDELIAASGFFAELVAPKGWTTYRTPLVTARYTPRGRFLRKFSDCISLSASGSYQEAKEKEMEHKKRNGPGTPPV